MPASLTDTLTEQRRLSAAVEHCLFDDPHRKPRGLNVERAVIHAEVMHEQAVAALVVVAQIRSEAEAILERHERYRTGDERCLHCGCYPWPCPDYRNAKAILALTGDTEEAT